MYAVSRIMLLGGVLVLAPMLTACESFDPDKLDIFGLTDKKKLPGERKALFPEGVPGVTQGIPPEYRRGAQQLATDPYFTQPAATEADTTSWTAAAPPQEPSPPPAAKPRAASKPKPKPTTASAPPPPPPQQPTASQQQQQSDWPDPNQQQTPWPSAPASGTFSR